MVNQLQFTQPQAYSGGADFSPLERLSYALMAQRQEAQQNEQAYQDVGGGQGQPPQSGGFLSDLGRRFGLIPEAVPGAPPARATAAVPTSPQVANGSGIGTMTPNARSWFNYAIRPVEAGGLGLSQAQAAGKVANLQAESTPNITPWGETGDQGTAQGSAQWRGDRLRNLFEFSKAKGLDYKTTEAQQAFMRHEYLGNDPQLGNAYGGGSEGKAYAALSATNSPEQAATAVNRYYERSADKSGRREAGAKRFAGAPMVAQGEGPNASFQATPRLPAGLTAPPDPNASPLDNAPWPQGNVGAPSPGAVAAGAPAPPLQTAAVPAAPVVASDAPEAKVAQNLVSGQPAAAAGVDREQIARMFRNPLTRPLATAILQKQMDPGSWSFQQVGDRLIGTHTKTGQVKVVMEDTKPLVFGNHALVRDPNSPSGYRDIAPPAPVQVPEGQQVLVPDPSAPTGYRDVTPGGAQSKAQRELAGRTYQADQLGLQGSKREFFLANGRIPTGDDVPAGDRRQIDKLQDVIDSSDAALNSLKHMKELSSKAWQGMGASALGTVTSNLPGPLGGAAGEATELLKNEQLRGALQQLKQIFTGSQSEKESAMLIELQGSINAPDNVRQGIYDRAIELVNDRVRKSASRQEAIANRSLYQPSGAAKSNQGANRGSAIQWSIVK